VVNIGRCKEGYKRVCADIPEETYDKIKNFNKTAIRPIIINRVIIEAVENEAKKIDSQEQ
jgi:predicted transcriptional regulator